MSTAEELFQTLGIDVFSLINDNCKYLPESFFELSKQDSIEVSVNPDNSVYKSLPLRIWDIRNIRNGKQVKSEIYISLIINYMKKSLFVRHKNFLITIEISIINETFF
jgi:hypothetical protein